MTIRLYPFSTPDGRDIPFEVIRPIGLTKVGFTYSTATVVYDVVVAEELVYLYATDACIVGFGRVAVLPAVDAIEENQFHFPAATGTALQVPADGISVYGLGGENGTLWIQKMEPWESLKSGQGFGRR